MIGLAAGATWLVVRISPTKDKTAAKQSSLGEHLEQRRVLKAVRLGDRLVRDLPVEHVHARCERPGRCATASASPWVAIASTYGSVAFVSAFVDVIGTAPGMFATQ